MKILQIALAYFTGGDIYAGTMPKTLQKNVVFRNKSTLMVIKMYDAVEFPLWSCEQELKALHKYWNELTYWDRLESLQHAETYLNICRSREVSPDDEIRIQTALKNISKFSDLNSQYKPKTRNNIISRLLKVQTKPIRPNARKCAKLIQNIDYLTPESLNRLNNHFEIDPSKSKYQRPYDLYLEIICDKLGTTAKFCALRNCLQRIRIE